MFSFINNKYCQFENKGIKYFRNPFSYATMQGLVAMLYYYVSQTAIVVPQL